MTFGWECIIDADGCDLQSIKSLTNIQAFIDELIIVTKMNKMGDLHSHYLEDTPEHRAKGIVGWSICQFIVTSSIVMHLCEDLDNNNGTLYLNFFSCKSFNQSDVVDLVIKYFKPSHMTRRMIDRDA